MFTPLIIIYGVDNFKVSFDLISRQPAVGSRQIVFPSADGLQTEDCGLPTSGYPVLCNKHIVVVIRQLIETINV